MRAQRFRRVVHEVDIGFLIQAAEHPGGVLERVDVANVAAVFGANGLLDCLRGAKVAGARRCGKDQNSRTVHGQAQRFGRITGGHNL